MLRNSVLFQKKKKKRNLVLFCVQEDTRVWT